MEWGTRWRRSSGRFENSRLYNDNANGSGGDEHGNIKAGEDFYADTGAFAAPTDVSRQARRYTFDHRRQIRCSDRRITACEPHSRFASRRGTSPSYSAISCFKKYIAFLGNQNRSGGLCLPLVRKNERLVYFQTRRCRCSSVGRAADL